MKTILFLLGTAREGRMSERVANFVLYTARTRGDINPIFVDVRDFPQSTTEGLSQERTEAWHALIAQADGLVIISPEYNHGYPGELKLLLDSAYKQYEGKSVGICGVSDGPIGGARMAEQLKLVLSAFQLTVVNAAVYFANVDKLFTEEGTLAQPDFWKERVNGMLDGVLKYAA